MNLINELWFDNYITGSERDQFSLMPVLWQAKVPFAVISNAKNFRKSPHVRFTKHRSMLSSATNRDNISDIKNKFPFLKRLDPKVLKLEIDSIFDCNLNREKFLTHQEAPWAKKKKIYPIWHVVNNVYLLQMMGDSSAEQYIYRLSRFLFGSEEARDPRAWKSGRIAYIANSEMPTRQANNVHVMKMCSAFVEAGLEIKLYAPEAKEAALMTPEAVFEGFGLKNSFKMQLFNVDDIALCTTLRMVDQAIKDGATLIYSRSVHASIFAALADVPTMLERHKDGSDKQIGFLSWLNSFRKLVVISEPLKASLKAISCNLDNKVEVLHDGADALTEKPLGFTLRQLRPGVTNLGYVGHLYPGKGAEIAVEIARLMPHVMVHMLGGHPEDVERWQSTTEDLENIVFYGHCPHADVPRFIEAVDICIAPFMRRVLGFGSSKDIGKFFSPLKLFEYMAHGKPIVTSDLPVLREILENRKNAIMCDPDNLKSFVLSIDELIANPEYGASLGRAAREVFESFYTWKQRAIRIASWAFESVAKITLAKMPLMPIGYSFGPKKPLIGWFTGAREGLQWAYGINAARLSKAITSCDHVIIDHDTREVPDLDLAIYFDLLIAQDKAFRQVRTHGKILRIGGATPLRKLSDGGGQSLTRMIREYDAVIALSNSGRPTRY
jgi:glycosyltransferase involved in cell wall biosynthesis